MATNHTTPSSTNPPALPIIHLSGKVLVTVASTEDGQATALVISVPEVEFRMSARLEDAATGIWSVDARHVQGRMSFPAVWEQIPRSVACKATGAPQIPVAIVVADVLDMSGRAGSPDQGYATRVANLNRCCVELEDAYGGDLMVTALRNAASAHGYELVPDLALVRQLGECQAYHELMGGIWDRFTADTRGPDMAALLEALIAYDTLRQDLTSDPEA